MSLATMPVSGEAVRTAPHAASKDLDRDISRRLRTAEVRLLSALATGVPLAVVADRLGMSERTVRRHIRTLCDEIGVRTAIEAIVWAARRRVI